MLKVAKKPSGPRSLRIVSDTIAPERKLKILVAAHSHPEYSRGGAEIAAHHLYGALNARPGYESWFLGCVRDEAHQKLGATINQPFSDREYIYAAGAFDWFKFANHDPRFPEEFRELLKRLAPDIVHFHHYLNFGVEAILHVRETLPECKIVMTLHEYLAICHHYGQMITKTRHSLCHEATPLRCSGCFPDISPSDFFLRAVYIKRFFDLVDGFIAPSEFLAERYAAWGIPRERISVIDNVIKPRALTNLAAPRHDRGDLLRVGFFGQISALKGIDVLFEAAEILMDRKFDQVVFEIYGDHRGQPPEFQASFLEKLAKVGRNVKYHGPYDQHRVDALMSAMDVILVPSIWWENSPVVIQEALRNQRPVVCSDIGGMAEKVRDGVDGYHFPVGNGMALAALLKKLATSENTVAELDKSVRSPPSMEDMMKRYDGYYTDMAAALLPARTSR